MNKIICLLFFTFLFVSCHSDRFSGISSPSERNKKSIESLRKELTDSPYGWKVMYFPKTDSLLFSDKDQVLENDIAFKNKYGYGGYYFSMKFEKDGIVKMLSDFSSETTKTEKTSEFSVKQNSYTELNFITPNYLHQLSNENLDGKSDFLYYGKNEDGNLVFKTSSYNEPAREYIIFEKISNAQQFKENVERSLVNRHFFDNMNNPQITIRKGSRIYFQSDVIIKTNYNKPFAEKIKNQRYYLFRFAKKRNADPNSITPDESNGLGSGYVGTEEGISFRAGIRYSKNYIFYDFKRDGDTFVCELVKVYDPILKRSRFVSKHLAPNYIEETGYIAEIKDIQR